MHRFWRYIYQRLIKLNQLEVTYGSEELITGLNGLQNIFHVLAGVEVGPNIRNLKLSKLYQPGHRP